MAKRHPLQRPAAAVALLALLALVLAATAADALSWPPSAFATSALNQVSVAAVSDYRDDAGWSVDFSSAPLTYYGQQWGSAAASDNGYLVFGDSFYPYDPSTFGNNGDGTPKVAPFFADASLRALDATGNPAGDIRIRVSDSVSEDGNKATALISRAFSGAPAFTPTKVLVSTWDGLLPAKYADDPPVDPSLANSFQAMLAWDSNRTFACYFYPTGGIKWAQSATMLSAAAVGFEKDDDADTKYELQPQSRNITAVSQLISSSNFGEPGTWCLQVDNGVTPGAPPKPPSPPPAMPPQPPPPYVASAKSPPPYVAPPVRLSLLQLPQQQLLAYLKALIAKYNTQYHRNYPKARNPWGRRLLL